MGLLDERSLATTLDAVAEELFFGRPIPGAEADSVARWLAGRQGLPGAYAGMFAPTSSDYHDGMRLFTGERIMSGAATGHILGEEACRTLLLLKVDSPVVVGALERAQESMEARLKESDVAARSPGFF
jgi:hypothetical protein